MVPTVTLVLLPVAQSGSVHHNSWQFAVTKMCDPYYPVTIILLKCTNCMLADWMTYEGMYSYWSWPLIRDEIELPPSLRLGTPNAYRSDGKAETERERDDSDVATGMKYGVASLWVGLILKRASGEFQGPQRLLHAFKDEHLERVGTAPNYLPKPPRFTSFGWKLKLDAKVIPLVFP